MTDQEARDYVEGAFQALKSRGWFQETGLVPTGVTDQEIADFEAEFGLKLPALYKAFLKSYEIEYDEFIGFWGVIHNWDLYTYPMPLLLDRGIEKLRSGMKAFRELATTEVAVGDHIATPEQYGYYLPIGLWADSDFLVWDLSKPEEQVDEEDWGESWLLRSFPHDEAWDEALWEEGGIPRFPSFKTLLDWYFYGTLIPEFEEEYQVKVNYERLNNLDFLWHYNEDRWKEKP